MMRHEVKCWTCNKRTTVSDSAPRRIKVLFTCVECSRR